MSTINVEILTAWIDDQRATGSVDALDRAHDRLIAVARTHDRDPSSQYAAEACLYARLATEDRIAGRIAAAITYEGELNRRIAAVRSIWGQI